MKSQKLDTMFWKCLIISVGGIVMVTVPLGITCYIIHDNWNIDFIMKSWIFQQNLFWIMMCLFVGLMFYTVLFRFGRCYGKFWKTLFSGMFVMYLVLLAGYVRNSIWIDDYIDHQFQQAEVTRTVKADHFTQIDGKTFVVNGYKYHVQSGNDVVTNYAKTPRKTRSIKIIWKEPGDRMSPVVKKFGDDGNLPMDNHWFTRQTYLSTPHDNDTLRVYIQK